MPTRKLTERERMELLTEILKKENAIAECEERKGNFTTAINKEIKSLEMAKNSARMQLNDDDNPGPQSGLPLEG
jgi:hypothetical protein